MDWVVFTPLYITQSVFLKHRPLVDNIIIWKEIIHMSAITSGVFWEIYNVRRHDVTLDNAALHRPLVNCGRRSHGRLFIYFIYLRADPGVARHVAA